MIFNLFKSSSIWLKLKKKKWNMVNFVIGSFKSADILFELQLK